MRIEIPGGHGVLIGDHGTQHNIIQNYIAVQAVSPAAAEPVVAGDVPQEPAAFQPRAGLAEALEPVPGARVSVVFAVTGIRGVGKTQVVAAYARGRIVDRWRLVAWVDASDTASVLAGLAQVAAAAGIGAAGEDAGELAGRVRHWLEADGERRLVVFDNAVDLDGLRPFLPAAGVGQVVITSNRQSAANMGRGVPVDVFTEGEALAFLAERTGLEDAGGARELAAELGFLPLGLAQAAALIAREHLEYGTYLGRLRALPVAEYLGRVEGDAYRYRTAEAIMLSLRSVEDADPSGRSPELMGLISVLAETGVSRRVLHPAVSREASGEDGDGAAGVDAAVGMLGDASLVGFSLDKAVVAHRLVMRVVRERLAAADALPSVAAEAVRVLIRLRDGIAEAWRDPAGVRELAGHVSALTMHVQGHPDVASGVLAADLLRLRLASVYLLNTLGDSTGRAIEAAEPLVADCERVLGADHPDTLKSRNNLAIAYQDAGRTAEAIALHEQTLADSERLLGADHPNTLNSRNNLAHSYRAAGRITEAVPLYEQTLAKRERVLDADHPDILNSREHLALAYMAAGRIAEAVPLLEQTLTGRERLLGADHPHTLNSRNDLASAYQLAGRITEAVPLLEQTLTGQERVLGTGHPNTLNSRNNLATAYLDAGQTAEAIALLEQTLAGQEQVLGADHPNTLTSRSNLARSYRVAGRLAEAVPLLEQILIDSERLLGADHPNTLTRRNNLAVAYRAAGRTAEAVPLLEQTLAGQEQVLGADHPDTLTSRNNLATAYLDAGRTAEAIALHEQTLAGQERVLGTDHPKTLISRSNLARSYRAAGRIAEGIALHEQTLAGQERVLGADHPNTLTSRNDLAVAYWAAGRTAEAIPLLEQALTDRERVLGADHPDTLTSRNNLATAYLDAGRSAEGIALLEQILADSERLLGTDHPNTLTHRDNLAYANQAATKRGRRKASKCKLAEAVARILPQHGSRKRRRPT